MTLRMWKRQKLMSGPDLPHACCPVQTGGYHKVCPRAEPRLLDRPGVPPHVDELRAVPGNESDPGAVDVLAGRIFGGKLKGFVEIRQRRENVIPLKSLSSLAGPESFQLPGVFVVGRICAGQCMLDAISADQKCHDNRDGCE